MPDLNPTLTRKLFHDYRLNRSACHPHRRKWDRRNSVKGITLRGGFLFPGWRAISVNAIRLTLLAVVLGISGCASLDAEVPAVSAPPKWIFSQEVIYRENHDPAMIWLEDDRHLRVVFGELGWEKVETWHRGRSLRLAYSQPTGCVLIDTATSEQLPVLAGLGSEHPLDLLLAQQLASAKSTQSMVEAYAANSELWRSESQRVLALLLNSAGVAARTRQMLRQAAAAWRVYHEAQTDTAASLSGRGGGTHWRIETARYDHELCRNQTAAIVALLDLAN